MSPVDGAGASNPNLPTRLDFTAAEDGDFTLVVEHLHGWGGPDEVYRITITPFEPGFSLSLNLDRYDLPGFHALNFVVHDSLAGGINRSPRLDAAAKGMAQQLLEFPIPVSASLAVSLRTQTEAAK